MTAATPTTIAAATPAVPSSAPRAKRVTSQEIDACGRRLRQGDLVAFPTETVYGLGCHALDEQACHKVFAAKERPLTDPLIVHVNHAADAFVLWQATTDEASTTQQSSLQARILTALCDAFWPGPLTLVAKASSAVPAVVMAGTGYCAARSPRHATARALIAAAAVPLAAPSANKFGHVSPTTAQHVWDDLQNENVWILEEQNDEPDNDTSRVGVESSVVKLEMNDQDSHGTLTVLRQGAVSVADLQAALQQVGLLDQVQVVAKTNQRVTEVTATVAPGQTIRHYSPNVPSYLLSAECVSSLAALPVVVDEDSSLSALLASTVILDYGKICATWQGHVLAYRDLSPSGNSVQAAQGIYDCLRWAEQVPQAKYILFPSLLCDDDMDHGSDALLLAVQDRLTRAASGVVLDSLDTLLPSSEA